MCKMRHLSVINKQELFKKMFQILLFFFSFQQSSPTSNMPSGTHLTVPSVDQNGHVLPHSSSDTSLPSQMSSLGSFNGPIPASKKKTITKFRQYLPQILAVSVKNVLLLAYGMTLGIATIVIPAVSDPEPDSGELFLTKNQISWFSKFYVCM